jgi:hypothetical protein
MIRDTVGALVFNEDLHAMLYRFEDDVDSSVTTPKPKPAPAPELTELFVPMSTTPPEDSRTVFLAFSVSEGGKPHGITSQDIVDHYKRYVLMELYLHALFISEPLAGGLVSCVRGGQFLCRVFGFPRHIERIEIEQPCTGQDSKHGIILFKSPENRKEAMFEETSSFFRIKSHDIWMQCYMPPF